MGVTHQKMGIWPKIHQWRRMVPLKTRFGVISPFFHLKGPLIFSGVMINWLKNFLKEKKVGVTYQIMGIWPIKHLQNPKKHYFVQKCLIEDFLLARFYQRNMFGVLKPPSVNPFCCDMEENCVLWCFGGVLWVKYPLYDGWPPLFFLSENSSINLSWPLKK